MLDIKKHNNELNCFSYGSNFLSRLPGKMEGIPVKKGYLEFLKVWNWGEFQQVTGFLSNTAVCTVY